jgi:hypothetical protein
LAVSRKTFTVSPGVLARRKNSSEEQEKKVETAIHFGFRFAASLVRDGANQPTATHMPVLRKRRCKAIPSLPDSSGRVEPIISSAIPV